MRDIKFRVWAASKKVLWDECPIVNFIGSNWSASVGVANSFSPLRGDVLMQFTGLLDKNGKDIYEGDIVSIPDLSTIGHKHEVVFDKGKFGFYEFRDSAELWSIGDMHPDDIEVIGSVHENPELFA